MNPYDKLKQMRIEAYKKRTGKEPHQYFTQEFNVKPPKTAAMLESLIIEYLGLKGACVTKVSTTGRPIVSRTTAKDVTGKQRTFTDVKYIPGSTRVGTADILGVYKSKPIAIEVKFSGDKLSDEQKQFREDWQDAGGLHYVIKSFEQITELI